MYTYMEAERRRRESPVAAVAATAAREFAI